MRDGWEVRTQRCLQAELAVSEGLTPVAFGVQVPLEFRTMQTAEETLQQENPRLT